MEMVNNYLMLELEKEKDNLKKMISNLNSELATDYKVPDYNVRNQLATIFPPNRDSEAKEINELIEKTESYLDTNKYIESLQKELKIKISDAQDVITSI